VIAVGAGVEHVGAGSEHRRDPAHVGQKLPGENGRTGAVGNDRVDSGVGDQRQCGQRSTSFCAR
jgi:hypothetical protein